MKIKLLLILLLFFALYTNAQENRIITNTNLANILEGNYNASDYAASTVLSHPDEIVPLIQNQINSDSLKSYLIELNNFYNRNSGSDTISVDTGIGAARNWILSKFNSFDQQNEDRLETGFLQFDRDICGMSRHKNVLACLPGTSETGEIVIIEAHMDSRCEEPCGIDCEARGMEDNGSGTALVIELARVMSQFTFEKTILFVTTTAEEQGLFGAEALAFYCKFDKPAIDVKAVFNNDVVGGIICGETSSEPSCPGEDLVDSTQVRLFSRGSFDSPHKSLARYTKLQYQQELLPYVQVPMLLTLMTAEDRTGRGGDHIPFGVKGLTAIRFTSAHEHGDAFIDEEYHDRQHTSKDVLGIDLDADGELDSFFVDFNYLARNTRINGVAAAMVSMSPAMVSMDVEWTGEKVDITVLDDNDYLHYVLGVRTLMNDFDTLLYFDGTKEFYFVPEMDIESLRLTIASVDENDVESCFSDELFVKQTVGVVKEKQSKYPVELWQNAPNPFDEATVIAVYVNQTFPYNNALIKIHSATGQWIKDMPIELNEGANEVLYTHGYGTNGIHSYSLFIDGELIESKKMVFAN